VTVILIFDIRLFIIIIYHRLDGSESDLQTQTQLQHHLQQGQEG
jgi:hypothetical protein